MTGAALRVGYLSASPRIRTLPDADADVVGPRAHVVGLIDALRAEGHVVEPFVLGDRRRLRGGATRPLDETGRASRLRRLAVDIVRLGLRPVSARWARRDLRGHVDVVYERVALFQELGRGWQTRGVPWVVETNALLAEEAQRERGALALVRTAWWLERRTYRRADLVVAVSEPLRDLLVARAGVPASRVLVVPNGVDVDRFPVTTGARPGPLVVGFVGFVIARQGLDELLEAVAAARAEDVDVQAVVVGDGPDRARLEARAVELGLAGLVRFTGQAPWEQVPAHLAGFSVGYSGQRGVAGLTMYHSPLKIYEYLASGLPVIASAHPDAVATLAASGAGWTFDPGNVLQLTALLRDVAALTPREREEAGRRGREHVEAHHTWRARARQVVEALQERGLVPR